MRGEVDLGLNSSISVFGSYECEDSQASPESVVEYLAELDLNQLKGLEQVVTNFERLLVSSKKDQLTKSDPVFEPDIVIRFSSLE